MRGTTALIALFCVAAGAGCGRTTHEALLMQQASAYHKDIRWMRLGEASARITPAQREKFLDAYRDRTETLQLEDYMVDAILYPQPGEAGYAAEPTLATLKVHRFEVESPEVTRRKVNLTEKWWFLDGAWYLRSGY